MCPYPQINALDQLLNLIANDDFDGVCAYLETSSDNREYDEVAFDKAKSLNRIAIAEFIKNRLDKAAQISEKYEQESWNRLNLYNRVELKFGRDYHFHRLQLNFELYNPTGKSNVNMGVANQKAAKVAFLITFRTELQAPYLYSLKEKYGAREQQNYLAINYLLDQQSPEQIRNHFWGVLDELTKKKVDGSSISIQEFYPFILALEAFFIDLKQNFPNKNDLMRKSLYQTQERKPHTVSGYALFRAAYLCDSHKMWELLRSGGDPNLYFEGLPMIHCVVQGADELFQMNPNNNGEQVLKTFKVLLEYGANPLLESSETDLTVLEYLAESVQWCQNEKHKELYEKIIRLLVAPMQSTPHVFIHPDHQKKELAGAIKETNREIERRLEIKPCITSVSETLEKNTSLFLNMHDGITISIESKQAIEVLRDEVLYTMLYRLFTKCCGIAPKTMSPKTYFDNLLDANSGTGRVFVDIIRSNNELKGFIISEVIYEPLGHGYETIYHAKLAYAEVNYPGLIKWLTWCRGFALYWRHPDYTHYSYSEAATARGFTLSDMVPRSPVLHVFKNELPRLCKIVHRNEKIVMKELNDCLYVEDPLEVVEKPTDPSKWATLSLFRQESFREKYRLPGFVLSVLFANDGINLRLFVNELAQTIKFEHCFQILAFYVNQLDSLKLEKSHEVDEKQVLTYQHKARM